MKKIIILIVFPLLFSACARVETSYRTTVLPDQDDLLGGTGIESTDIRTIARKMSESMLEVPEIARAEGIPRIALLPVKNSTRFIINSDIFTDRIRIELNRNATGRVRFLARDRIEDILRERESKREGLFTTSKEADLLGVDFFLTGEITGISKAVAGHRSDYLLMFFQLIDSETSDIIWEDAYEVKRVGRVGAVYR